MRRKRVINKVYKGDCLEILPTLKTKFDLIVTDLPYGVTRNSIDIVIPFKKMWENILPLRKSAETPIVLFGQGLFAYKLALSNEKMFKYEIIWDKQLTSGFLNAKKMPLRQHENILVFYEKTPKYNPQYTKGRPLHSKGTLYKDKEHTNRNYGDFKMTDDDRAGSTDKYPTSILSIQKPHPSTAIHPTEKPVELMKWLVSTFTDKGDNVLDFTAGSGTTGVACREIERNYVLIEKNEDNYNLIEDRLSHKVALDLF